MLLASKVQFRPGISNADFAHSIQAEPPTSNLIGQTVFFVSLLALIVIIVARCFLAAHQDPNGPEFHKREL